MWFPELSAAPQKRADKCKATSLALDSAFAFFGSRMALLIHPALTADISPFQRMLVTTIGVVLHGSQSPFRNAVSLTPHHGPGRVIGDEEAKVFPRPHGQASSPESVVPNPCSSTHTHVVFSLELLLRPRQPPWLRLPVSVQNLFFFCSILSCQCAPIVEPRLGLFDSYFWRPVSLKGRHWVRERRQQKKMKHRTKGVSGRKELEKEHLREEWAAWCG